METYYTDNQDYTNASVPKLVAIEPAMGNADGLKVTGRSPTGDTITVTSKASGTPTFSITNNGGTVTRTCSVKDTGGCSPGRASVDRNPVLRKKKNSANGVMGLELDAGFSLPPR